MSYKKTLDLMFCRPGESIDTPKTNKKLCIKVPTSYQHPDVDRYNHDYDDDEEVLEINEMDELPDIEFTKEIGKYEMFCSYLPKHRRIASQLTEIFMDCEDTDELLSTVVYCRDILNPYLFFYALNIAILNREDTRDFNLRCLNSYFPDKFIDGKVFQNAREEVSIVPEGSRIPITIPVNFTANYLYHEHYVSYFREDVGLSLYYWYWNLMYPSESCELSIVDKNRRGELFYYTNQQIIARYNCERLCNTLFRVKRLNNLTKPIPEGYFPKLDNQLSSENCPPRFCDSLLKDLNRRDMELRMDLSELDQYAERVKEAIDQGYAVNKKGEKIMLDAKTGIDCLGNIIQSSMLSPNRKFYGSLCDFGHLFMAYCHDPEGKHLEPHSVLGEFATCLRDPLFYRWHAYIDYIFQLHKNCLTPYTKEELSYSGINVTSIETRFDDPIEGTLKNELHTYWQQSDLDLARGLDYSKNESVFVRTTHLNHHAFKYTIKVKNLSSVQKVGTVRIFMAPKHDETNVLLTFDEQRLLMIELDKFKCVFGPGSNVVTRKSEESSVSILYDNMFNNGLVTYKQDNKNEYYYCGCGYPQHLLIPKGSSGGTEYCLFVMVSDINGDRVDQGKIEKYKDDTTSYCGIPNRKYPDARNMGFPFDRKSEEHVNYINDFKTPNMCTRDIMIKFNDIIVTRPAGVPPPITTPGTKPK